MKIGIDIDGVITEVPDFIKHITSNPDYEVHIITYRDPKGGKRLETRDFLRALDIRFDHLHMTAEDVDMVEWKVSVVKEFGIEMMIEDTPEILAAMPPKVQRLWICNPDVYDLNKAVEVMRS